MSESRKQPPKDPPKPDGDHDHDSNWNGNWNGNHNGNLNLNGNANLNGNLNLNGNANLNGNLNFNENVNINKVTTDVEVDVDVKVDVSVDVKGAHQLHDNDVNDIDNEDLINVAAGGSLDMGDFTKRDLAVGNSFNEGGNDSLTRIGQSNSMTDIDVLVSPLVQYLGPDTGPFQDVDLDGGRATSDDGIEGNSDANHNDGDGSVIGATSATADAIGNIQAFTQDITMGGNTQANLSTLNVIGGNSVRADDIGKGRHGDDPKPHPSDAEARVGQPPGGGNGGDGGGGHGGGGGGGHDDPHDPKDPPILTDYDDDVNDIDQSSLINVGSLAGVWMDDFSLDVTAIGNSFNGAGNDMLFDVNQVNDMVDNDYLFHPVVQYCPDYAKCGDDGALGDAAFQKITATGGGSNAGDGIYGNSNANDNGGNGLVSGASAAAASANVTAEAFTQNIVMGANLQLNNSSLTLIGGDSTVADDIGGGGH